MLARMNAAEKKQGMEICQRDLAEIFKFVSEKVRGDQLPGYQIVNEKSSGTEILYKIGERFSMTPLAAMANDKVFPLPAPLDPESTEAFVQLLCVNTKLREIAASVSPSVTPV